MSRPVLCVFLWCHWYYRKILLLFFLFFFLDLLVHLPSLDQVLTTVTLPSGCQTVSELYKHWTEVPHRSSVSVFNAVCCSLTYWPLSWHFKVKGHLPRYTVATVVIPRWDMTCRNHTRVGRSCHTESRFNISVIANISCRILDISLQNVNILSHSSIFKVANISIFCWCVCCSFNAES